ncbi:hypothetical protein BDD12DRAFT_165998 [Trichophaea hybrida]|nr:hypothetical protein BDD12DRAFT_165998 [Trichophaea hybrida]
MVHSPAASSLSFSSSLPSSPFHHPQGQGSTANSTGPDNSLPSVKEPPPPSSLEGRNLRVDSVRPATSYSSHTTSGFSDFDRFSIGVSSFASSSRSSSVDLGRKASIATATAVVKIRPVLRVNPKSVSHSSSTSSSPQRRPPQPPSSPITTPSTAASDNYFHWKQVSSLPPAESTPQVLPDLNLRPESDGFSTIPELTTAPLNIQKALPSAPLPISKPQLSTRTQTGLSKSRHNRPGSHNRTQSPKAMLGSALERAHTAVTLDNAGNYEGAMEAYEDACALLSEVMGRAGEHNDRAKLQTIVSTFLTSIYTRLGWGAIINADCRCATIERYL